MSFYMETTAIKVKDVEALRRALEELGYPVEVYDQATMLYGYKGDIRPERAHLIIRRQHTGIPASNDIGFLRRDDGTVTAIISEYDRHQGFNADWLTKVVTLSGVHAVLKEAARLGRRAVRTINAKNEPQVELYVQ